MKNLSLFLISFCIALNITSCGSNLTEGSSELISRADISPTEGDTEVYDTSGALLALCSILKDTDSQFSSQLELYYRQGDYISDQILLRFRQTPAEIAAGTQFINFFKQYEPSSGGVLTENSPVEFVFIHKVDRVEISTQASINSLSKGVLESVIEENNLANLGYTPENFLYYFNLVLRGMDLKYESLVMSLYATDNPSTSIGSASALLPSFPADPNTYAKADNSDYLVRMHPMYSRKDSGLTETQFKNEIERVCLEPI